MDDIEHAGPGEALRQWNSPFSEASDPTSQLKSRPEWKTYCAMYVDYVLDSPCFRSFEIPDLQHFPKERGVPVGRVKASWSWETPRDVNIYIVEHSTQSRPDRDSGSSEDSGDFSWVKSGEGILNRLDSDSTTEDDRITAVLFAETMSFSGQERMRLLDGLHPFVVQRRFSEDTETLTAVGSAIRKFAMNMDVPDLARYGDLFDYSDTEHLSCQVELELVKAAGWRLAELPRAEIKDSQKLEQRILEIVEAYLPPKLLLQKNYTAIVLNGLTALALLDSAKVDPLIDRVASLEASGKPVVWFRELLADRLREVAKQQDKCDPQRGVKLERWAQELDPATV